MERWQEMWVATRGANVIGEIANCPLTGNYIARRYGSDGVRYFDSVGDARSWVNEAPVLPWEN